MASLRARSPQKVFVLIVALLELSVPASGLSAAPSSQARQDGDSTVVVVGPRELSHQSSLNHMNHRLNAMVRSDLFAIIYFCSLITVVLLTIFIFHGRGFLVCGGIIGYLLSLATMTLTIKAVYVKQEYTYPKLVSAIHFMLSGLACFTYLLYLRRTNGVPIKVPNKEQMMLILPVSLAFAASIGASNSALVYSNAGFVEMINSCGPLSTALVCVIFGMGFDLRLVSPVLLVTAGMALCAFGEIKFSWLGFTFSLASTFIRSFKAALQQKILSPVDAEQGKLSPAELLAWMSIPSTLWMLAWSFLSEGLAPYPLLVGTRGPAIVAAIAVTCVNAVCLNMAQFFVIQHLGAVGGSIAANLKGALLLLGSVAIFGDVITLTQIMGFGLQICGICWFNKTDQDIKAAAASEKAPLLNQPKDTRTS